MSPVLIPSIVHLCVRLFQTTVVFKEHKRKFAEMYCIAFRFCILINLFFIGEVE